MKSGDKWLFLEVTHIYVRKVRGEADGEREREREREERRKAKGGKSGIVLMNGGVAVLAGLWKSVFPSAFKVASSGAGGKGLMVVIYLFCFLGILREESLFLGLRGPLCEPRVY